MSFNSSGSNFRITTFGESHGPALGVMIDGLPPGLSIDLGGVQVLLDRRRPGRSPASSSRAEGDQAMVLSGLRDGKTTGMPLAMVVTNDDAQPGAYDHLKEVYRPSHADFTYQGKYGLRDWRGGGRSSGRETVARVAAGAVALQLLARQGVKILAHTVQVGPVEVRAFYETDIELNPLRCADLAAAHAMMGAILDAAAHGDSVGGAGVVTVREAPAVWLEEGEDLAASLGEALMSIGAVKAVSLAPSRRPGELSLRFAVKPTPSIRQPQRTVNTSGEAVELSVQGRHDPCIVPRVLPVAESMVALVLADRLLAT